MNIYEKLLNIQSELKVPKSNRNSFGGYNYRSTEDIVESMKPLLKKYNAALVIEDELELIGDRYYIKATTKLIDVETNEIVETKAYAREELSKKGMDASQITGAASSYARKYALNGLLAIDDTKDSDATNNHNKLEVCEDDEIPFDGPSEFTTLSEATEDLGRSVRRRRRKE